MPAGSIVEGGRPSRVGRDKVQVGDGRIRELQAKTPPCLEARIAFQEELVAPASFQTSAVSGIPEKKTRCASGS